MKLDLDIKDKAPLYRQVADQMHFAINTGKFGKETRLPSLRQMALDNFLALNTVAKAYGELEKRGVIEARNRSGYHIKATETIDAGRYAARGVSATKKEIHRAVDKLDRGIYPGAFCKITEDFLTGDPNRCNVIHADGSGTKAVIAYLHWREHGDADVFKGIAQDSLVMNLDDLLCVGAASRILFSNTINRNARNIPGEVLGALIEGTEEFLGQLRVLGIDVISGGGETADVGDLTPTLTVDSCAVAVMDKGAVLTGDGIVPGLVIVGLASDGQASYESQPNSGMGSNGLTSARHDLLSGYYRTSYPETWDKNTPPHLVYSGPYRLEDALPGSELTVGAAILSPTRTYAPVIARLLKERPGLIRGLVHCSGGGQTKCLRFGKRVHFIKDRLFQPPPIFRVIQHTSETPWKEMYQVFNMGHRMEVYCKPNDADAVIEASELFGIAARVIGHTEKSVRPDKGNHLTLYHGKRKLIYRLEN